jgi:hypothetical protein
VQPEPSRVLEKAKRAEELGPCRACTICITPCWPCAKARCVAGVQVREMSQWQTVFVTMHGGDHEKERQAPNEDAHEAGISREPICLPRVPMQQQPRPPVRALGLFRVEIVGFFDMRLGTPVFALVLVVAIGCTFVVSSMWRVCPRVELLLIAVPSPPTSICKACVEVRSWEYPPKARVIRCRRSAEQ